MFSSNSSTQLSLPSSAHLRVSGVSVSFPDRKVLANISFTASTGEVLGLVGENGSGKSTLLRVTAGQLKPDSGTVEIFGAAGVGLLHQEPPFSLDDTLEAIIEDAVAVPRRAEARLNASAKALSEDPGSSLAESKYVAALEETERLGVWSVDAEIGETLSSLGLSELAQSRRARTLSGGQRARLSLAWLLLSHPQLLLLDEPTNHLDERAAAFLASRVSAWRGPVVFASHDRAFLDEVATGILDLDPSPRPHSAAQSGSTDHANAEGLTRFTGNYTDYLGHRAAARTRWEKQYEDEQKELKRLRASVRHSHVVGHTDWKPRTETKIAKKFYGDRNAKVVSRRVSDSERRLKALEEDQVIRPPRLLTFSGLSRLSPGPGGSVSAREPGASTGSNAPQEGAAQTVLSLSRVGVKGRLAPVSFALSAGEQLLITGANGTGKSTLLSLIAGTLSPTTGTLNRPRSARVGFLSQEIGLNSGGKPLDLGATALEIYAAIVGEETAEKVSLSSLGLLPPRDLNRAVRTLSVGQQRRLQLATLVASPPEILLLDEPTNHLSLSLVSALEEQLPEYPGSVIVASHDRWLRQHWKGRALDLEVAW